MDRDPKRIALHCILTIVLIIELIRMTFELKIFGLKEHESKRVSAYVWASFGFALAFLLFEPVLVVPVIFGMAWIDPLCGWLREKGRGYPVVPIIVYAFLMLTILLLISNYSVLKIIILAVVGSITAISSEHPDLKHVDDDFLMVIIPLVILAFPSQITI